MQWTRIKTLFIFSFLILDLFLMTQLIGKQEEDDVDVMENKDASIEQQLENENINIKADLDQEQLEEFYIAVGQKRFKKDKDESALNDLSNQTVTVVDHNLIVSDLDESIQVSKDASEENITAIADQLFLNPEQYTFWNWNKEKNILMFFQKKNNRPVYYNQSGIVMVFLNDDNEIKYYTQTMLGDAEKSGDKKQLISPMNAIDELYQENELNSGDNVTKVDMGYHTMVPLENGIQSFAPSWKITVNDDKHFFVNAIEGRIFFSSEQKFLEKAISAMHEKTAGSDIDIEDKDEIMKRFETIMDNGEAE